MSSSRAFILAAALLLGASPANAPYVAQIVPAMPANERAPRYLFISESALREGPGLAIIGQPTLIATALLPWSRIVDADFHGVNPLPQVSPERMILNLQLSYKGNDADNNSAAYNGNVTLNLDAATGRVLSYQQEGTIPSSAPKALAAGPCPSFLADTQVDTIIDPDVPEWMHELAHKAILEAPPCLRRYGIFTGADPSGRFWSNRISEVRENEREHAFAWKWVGAGSWQDPSGAVIPIPNDPLRMPLIGTWSCTDGQYTFRAAGTGHFTDNNQPNNSTDFIYAIDERFAKRFHVTFVRIGFGHAGGEQYAIAFDGPLKLHLKDTARYFAHDRDWGALPTQNTMDCTRAPKPPPPPSA